MQLIQQITNLFKKGTEEKKVDSFWIDLLGYEPENLQLYEQALTHRSLDKHSNERLEYLGDAVISLVVAEYLYDKYPNANEGLLTRMRAKIVCRGNLNDTAKRLQLNKHLHKGTPLKQHAENVYGNALEALIGAIFTDKGYITARQFTDNHIIGKNGQYIENILKTISDYKSELLELCQAKKLKIDYQLIREDYSPKTDSHIFTYQTLINDKIIAKAEGKNKHEAQQNVSMETLHIINNKLPII